MPKAIFLALAALGTLAAAQVPQQIDVSQLPKQTDMVDGVVVPVPSEIFGVLDKMGKVAWQEVLRPMKDVAKPKGGQEQTALLLGNVIAEGFIAVEAENTEEVKKIGNSVRILAKAIGVEKAVISRASAIIEGADKKSWQSVRKELDGARADVKEAMTELNSAPLSELVSLGGWLRGTEALTAVVQRTFTKDGAELLHQPILLDYFDRKIANMPKRMKDNLIVTKIQQGLVEIRPLMGEEITESKVKQISVISERLIQLIHSKGNE